MRTFRFLVALSLLLFAGGSALSAQTSSTATVTGSVFDKTGAAVPSATVELRDASTNDVHTTTTNDVGQYSFLAIPPGVYKVAVTATGFRKAVVNDLKLAVGKSAVVNVTLEVGTVAQVVEVQAGVGTELQTLDSSVGNVLEKRILDNIPSLSRDATALLLFQPMATPGFNQNPLIGANGEGDSTGGQVAGARSDQNTFLVDGGDASDSTAGGGQYSGTNFTATPRAVVPTPVESLEEFRVVTNNPSASFGRSEGGVVQMVTRRGGNEFHGAAYEFNQNEIFNANSWTRNRLGENRPKWRDNRYGARLGGYIWKDRTFFFVHYEGRRFMQGVDIQRLVPSESLKVGILKFRDASGNIVPYNLNPGSTVDPTTGATVASSGLDPRDIGLNSVISSLWAFEPVGNDFTRGDGLNTVGFTSTAPFKIHEEFGVARLDHKINDKWDVMLSFRDSTTDAPSTAQMDIGGLLPGDVKGKPVLTSQRPLQPRYLVAGVTGQITPHLLSEFHFDWLRHWWQWGTVHPFPQVAGTSAGLFVGGESQAGSLIPINYDVQNARSRMWNGKDFNFSENMSWTKGTHLIQFGGRAATQRFFHMRDDKVLGALIYPTYTVGRVSSALNISSAYRPPTCSGTVTTNCLNSADVPSYRNFYASVLGIVNRGQQLLTRASDLTPNPPLTPLTQHTIVNSYQLHVSDTWRLSPSFTVTYGLTWGVQLPPYEQTGKQTMMVNDSNGSLIIGGDYLAARQAAALNGQVYNPQLDFVPIRKTGRKYPYDPDWTNFAPRVSAAWNPSFSDGWLGALLGERKTVIRGGYARAYDRINGVGIVMIPALGIGFGNFVRCNGPRMAGGCASGSNPANAFRIGTDGSSIPMPSLAPVTSPLVPGTNSPYETLDFRIDPKHKVGYSDGWDLTVQRELPGNMLVEVGYVGRYSKKLYQGYALNHVPYMMKAGGQNFAQAFSAARQYLLGGGNPLTIPNTVAPWFDAMLNASGYCAGYVNCAAATIDQNGASAFLFSNVYDVWEGIDSSFPSGAGGADTNQIDSIYWIGTGGRSNYNAGFISLHKRSSHGLVFDVNYTLSHAFDQVGQNQESLNETTDAFNLNRDYGSASFDRRHTLTAIVNYELPFGHNKRFSSGNWGDNLIGGWSVSTAYVYGSGLPLDVFNGNSCEEYGADDFFGNCSAYRAVGPPSVVNASPHRGVTGSGGIGVTGNVNAFTDPAAVYNNFRTPDILLDGRTGRGGVRSMGRWNVDFGVNKTTKITERITTRFDVQITNLFNHPLLSSSQGNDVNIDLSSPRKFGVLGTQYNQGRFIQLGLRFDF